MSPFASGKTSANGAFSIPVSLKLSGTLSVTYGGAPGVPAAAAEVDNVTAATWDVTIGAVTATPTSVAPAAPSTITGSVTRTYSGVTEPAKSLALLVTVQPTGGTATTARTVTNATGGFALKVAPRVTTTYTVKVVGVAGHGGATAAPVTVTVVP